MKINPDNTVNIRMLQVGTACCFGTFGELLQGVLTNGRHFLVTLPIALYSTAQYIPSYQSEIRVFPPHKTKSKRLATELIQTRLGNFGGDLFIHSELPEGKGCASSSADMVATALAVQRAFGFTIPQDELAVMMARFEPSDGVMYQGVVSFYHQEGVLRRYLGYLPPLVIIAIDEGGCVDTVEFNQNKQDIPSETRIEYANLLDKIEYGVACQDLTILGECSTRSAILNQQFLPKRHLQLFLDLHQQHNTIGVAVAHSGTLIGLLLDPTLPTHVQDLAVIINTLSEYSYSLRIYRTHFFNRGDDHAL